MQSVEFKDKSKLIISKEVLAQISYFHHKVGKFEWSGLLFYRIISGEVTTPGSLVLKAERIYLMDIGSYSYTEFSPDEGIVDFYEKYPESTTMKWGMVHSHQEFNTFFSGTDMDELKSNAGAHNFYLSLIVNFKDGGNFCAKIGIIAEAEVETKYNFFHGLNFLGLNEKLPKVKEKRLMTIDCIVEYELDTFDTDRYDSIKTKKEEEAKKKAEASKNVEFPTYPSKSHGKQLSFDDQFYVPKTANELDSYLAKAVTMDFKFRGSLKEAFDIVEKEQEKYGDQFEFIYWDAFDYGLDGTYWETFSKVLPVEHHNKFYKQCIAYMDKYRMCGYDFYDKIIDTFEMYIDVNVFDDFEDFSSKKGKQKVHAFSGKNVDTLIAQADKMLNKNKKKKK